MKDCVDYTIVLELFCILLRSIFLSKYRRSRYRFYFLVPPRIVPFSFEEPIFAGQAAQVTCLVSEGDLPLDITWTYQGSSNRSMMDLGISTSRFGQKTSMLLIESTNAEHRGNYTCTAKSLSTLQLSSHYSAELNIHGKHFQTKELNGICSRLDMCMRFFYLKEWSILSFRIYA